MELKLTLATATGKDSAGRLLLATAANANANLQAVFVVIFALSTCCLKLHPFSFTAEVNKRTNAHTSLNILIGRNRFGLNGNSNLGLINGSIYTKSLLSLEKTFSCHFNCTQLI